MQAAVEYKTMTVSNVYLAAWLVYNGYKCEYVYNKSSGKVLFEFPLDDDINDTSERYQHEAVGCTDISRYNRIHAEMWGRMASIKDRNRDYRYSCDERLRPEPSDI